MNNEYRDVVSYDGTLLKCLIRETGSSKWLIVTHGLGEHGGRHEYILKLFSQNFNIAIYDLRGHGRSGGPRVYIEDFQSFSKDLHSILEFLKKDFNMIDYTLFGHSMGGLITANYLQNMAQKHFYPTSVYLSSPATAAPGFKGPIFSNSPEILYQGLLKLPSMRVAGLLNLRRLSHDSRVYEAYVKDDLNELKIHTRLFLEILKTARDVFSRPLRAECPLFCSVGTEDELVNPKSIHKYFNEIEKNCQLKEFTGGYHELHNEVDKYRKPYLNFLRQSLTGLSFE